MLTPEQIRIFEAFLRKPYQARTYKEIKMHAKKKSNSIIQNAIAKFLAEGLIRKESVGNNLLYRLNLENESVFSYSDILINEKLSPIIKTTLQIIKREIGEIAFVSIVIFGSYVDGKQTEKSDLDLALFVSTKKDKRICELAMKSVELRSVLSIDAHVITKGEMLKMLKDKRENLGKQIVHKHLATYNPAIFYSIVQEGVNHGFKVIYA